MKNISFLTLFLLCFTNSISSQSLSLEYDSYSYSSPGEVNEMKIYVTNETDQNLPIIVTKTVITDLDVVSTFCWGSTCYTPTTSVSTYSEVINAGSTSSAFTGADPAATYAIDEIEDAVLSCSNSSINLSAEKIVSELDYNVYPNPASNFVNLEFKNNSSESTVKVQIINVLGEIVLDTPLNINSNSNIIRLPLLNLNNGTYQINLTVGSNLLTKTINVFN